MPEDHMKDDDMYEDPGGTTQKLPSGLDDTAAPKFDTDVPTSRAISMPFNSFSSLILVETTDVRGDT
jgi:hypothetical protein